MSLVLQGRPILGSFMLQGGALHYVTSDPGRAPPYCRPLVRAAPPLAAFPGSQIGKPGAVRNGRMRKGQRHNVSALYLISAVCA